MLGDGIKPSELEEAIGAAAGIFRVWRHRYGELAHIGRVYVGNKWVLSEMDALVLTVANRLLRGQIVTSVPVALKIANAVSWQLKERIVGAPVPRYSFVTADGDGIDALATDEPRHAAAAGAVVLLLDVAELATRCRTVLDRAAAIRNEEAA